jgi:shikimate dehydrogenase
MNGDGDLGIDFSMLTSKMTITDIVYTPLETDLLRHAKQRGCTCVNGLGMLIYQGIPGFENWFDATPVVTDELRELLLS